MDQVADIIAKAIGLPSENGPVRRILVGSTTDSEGKDALDVTIVLDDDLLSGSQAVTILSDIQQALLDAGDQRFPIIEFATEDEMAFDGGPEA